MQPKIRFGHTIIKLDNGNYLAGSATPGIAQIIKLSNAEIDLCQLNKILAGNLEYHEAINNISKYYKISIKHSQEMIDFLISGGHIENASEHFSRKLNYSQKERYSRSINLYSWMSTSGTKNPSEFQYILGQTTVCIIGCGGIGGGVALQLAASGIKKLILVDFDRVEVSNLNRQIAFKEEDVGELKTFSLLHRIKDLNSNVEIEIYNKKISNKEDILELFNKSDILYRTADTPDMMPYWTSDASLKSGKPWIDCSYNGPIIVCCIFSPAETGCYRCVREKNKSDLRQGGATNIYSDHASSQNAANAPLVQMASSFAAMEGIRFITGISPQTLGRAFHHNVIDYTRSYYIEVPDECSHK